MYAKEELQKYSDLISFLNEDDHSKLSQIIFTNLASHYLLSENLTNVLAIVSSLGKPIHLEFLLNLRSFSKNDLLQSIEIARESEQPEILERLELFKKKQHLMNVVTKERHLLHALKLNHQEIVPLLEQGYKIYNTRRLLSPKTLKLISLSSLELLAEYHALPRNITIETLKYLSLLVTAKNPNTEEFNQLEKLANLAHLDLTEIMHFLVSHEYYDQIIKLRNKGVVSQPIDALLRSIPIFLEDYQIVINDDLLSFYQNTIEVWKEYQLTIDAIKIIDLFLKNPGKEIIDYMITSQNKLSKDLDLLENYLLSAAYNNITTVFEMVLCREYLKKTRVQAACLITAIFNNSRAFIQKLMQACYFNIPILNQILEIAILSDDETLLPFIIEQIKTNGYPWPVPSTNSKDLLLTCIRTNKENARQLLLSEGYIQNASASRTPVVFFKATSQPTSAATDNIPRI